MPEFCRRLDREAIPALVIREQLCHGSAVAVDLANARQVLPTPPATDGKVTTLSGSKAALREAQLDAGVAGQEASRPPFSTTQAVVRGLVRTMRPRQWIKNILVLAAPFVGGGLLPIWARPRSW